MFKPSTLFAVLTLAAISGGCRRPTDNNLSPFDESTCPFALHATQVTAPSSTQTARCGMLSVLESRDGSSDRHIQVPALIFKS